MGRVWERWRGRWARPALGEERGQALILAARRRLRADRRGPGAGRDRRRGDRQGEGAAGRRPGGDLGRALDARRPAAAALAADAAQRPAEPGAHGQARLPGAGAGRGGRRRPGERRRPGPPAGRLPRRRLLRPGPGQGHGRRRPRGRAAGGEVEASAVAEAAAPCGAAAGAMPAMASGGGYSGPLVYRDGEGMRPDVAAAFDRMAAAARGAGISLLGQLRLPLRRRTGGALRRPPRPDLGGAAGPLAAPLRDRARPRPRIRLRLARRQRRPLRLRPALLAGRPGTTATTPARRPARTAGQRASGGGTGGGDGAVAGGAACPSFVPARFRDAAAARRRPLERLRRPARRAS